jgi:hypothetical protein
MPRDVLPFRAGETDRTAHAGRSPDVAFAALPLLRRLRDAFELAGRRAKPKSRWGVPPLFFFDKQVQAEWNGVRSLREREGPGVSGLVYGKGTPDRSRSERTTFSDLADDALTLLAGSIEVRRAARVVTGLQAAAERLASEDAKAQLVAGLLAIPDDEVMLALHPATRTGWRVRLGGVADLAQFHILLADLVPGPRPDERVVEAYRDGPIDPEADIATARFQMYRADALRPGGTLPKPFRAAELWLWGHESPADVPAVNGERVVLLGDPPYPRAWPAGRRFPMVRGELELLEVLGAAAVGEWIASRIGTEPAPVRRAA